MEIPELVTKKDAIRCTIYFLDMQKMHILHSVLKNYQFYLTSLLFNPIKPRGTIWFRNAANQFAVLIPIFFKKNICFSWWQKFRDKMGPKLLFYKYGAKWNFLHFKKINNSVLYGLRYNEIWTEMKLLMECETQFKFNHDVILLFYHCY